MIGYAMGRTRLGPIMTLIVAGLSEVTPWLHVLNFV
jgi:hypothetical protein